MIDFRILQYKNLLNELFGVSENCHSEKALLFVLGPDYTNEKAGEINQLYIVNQRKIYDILIEFKNCSEKNIGFSTSESPQDSSTIRTLVGKSATDTEVEQYIADAVQAHFFILMNLRNLLEVKYYGRAGFVQLEFPAVVSKHKSVIMHIGNSYNSRGLGSDKSALLIIELFVKAYNKIFQKSKMFSLKDS